MTFRTLVDELNAQSYVRVPYSLNAGSLTKAAEQYLEFLKLPKEEKESLSITMGGVHLNTDLGYKRKFMATGEDEKEYFHFHEALPVYLADRPAITKPVVQELLAVAATVNAAAKETLRSTLAVFEPEFPGITEEFLPEGTPNTILRLIKYSNVGKGNALARGHYDAGGCTLSLMESTQGLRVGRTSDELVPVEYRENTAVFFPALNFQSVTDERFPPVWHDAVQYEDTEKECARWAIVFFANPKSLAKLPDAKDVRTPLSANY